MNTEKTLVNCYFHGARYFDPQLSRWPCPDPLSESYSSLSPFAYVANNPVNYIDPNGMLYAKPSDWERQQAQEGGGYYNWELAMKVAGMMGSQFEFSASAQYTGSPERGIEVGTHFNWRTGKEYKVYEDPITGERYYRQQTGTKS